VRLLVSDSGRERELPVMRSYGSFASILEAPPRRAPRQIAPLDSGFASRKQPEAPRLASRGWPERWVLVEAHPGAGQPGIAAHGVRLQQCRRRRSWPPVLVKRFEVAQQVVLDRGRKVPAGIDDAVRLGGAECAAGVRKGAAVGLRPV